MHGETHKNSEAYIDGKRRLRSSLLFKQKAILSLPKKVSEITEDFNSKLSYTIDFVYFSENFTNVWPEWTKVSQLKIEI